MPNANRLPDIVTTLEETLKGASGFSKPVRSNVLREALEVLKWLIENRKNLNDLALPTEEEAAI